jgi:hypothetical protein
MANEFELIICHTPTVEKFLKPHARRTAVVPIGYEPGTLGTPDWSCPKTADIGYCGSAVGRRMGIVPFLEGRLKGMFRHFGAWGLDRKAIYDSCRTALYIGHSSEQSFSTSRLWAAIATSATLLTEPRDAWPAVAGRHYIELPKADDTERFYEALVKTLERNDLPEIARRAHEELSAYTIERCMNEFLVPATMVGK